MTFRRLILLVLSALLAFSMAGSAVAQAPPVGNVAIIAVPGLQWGDIDKRLTPHLWELIGRGSSAAMSDRAFPGPGGQTCVSTGWLTLSSGQRATTTAQECALPPTPQISGEGAYVPNFREIRAFNAGSSYRADVGVLGEQVRRSGGRTAAIGPGAAMGAADYDGRVEYYAETPGQAGDLRPYSLIVAEADAFIQAMVALADSPDGIQRGFVNEDRYVAAVAADRQVGELLSVMPSAATILLAGLSDVTDKHLHTAIAVGDDYQQGLMTSSSTRREGLIVLPDITSAAFQALRLEQPRAVVGRPPASVGGPLPSAVVTADLHDKDLATQVRNHYIQPFYAWLLLAQLALYVVAAIVMSWRRLAELPYVRTALRVAALATASLPVASFLMNLVPWWRSAPPNPAAPAIMAALGGVIAIVTAVACLGPWRRSVLGPLTVVAGTTAVVLAVDAVTRSNLQMYAFTGYDPVTAGRFIGFSNMGYAAFAAGALLSIAWLARGQGRNRMLLAGGAGAVAALVIGMPTLGTNFGGLISFVPGLAVCLLMLANIKITIRRLVLVLAGAGVLVLIVAGLDWLRPATSRSHFGGFFANLIEGEAWHVVARKFTAMINTLANWQLDVLALAAIAFFALVLVRSGVMARVHAQAPTLRPAIAGALTTIFIGLLVNDSGIAIPAMGLTVVVPLALAASLTLDQSQDRTMRVPSAKATSRN